MTEKSNRTAPETVRIQLDPCVTFSDREIAGRTVSIAHHAGLAKYFQFGIVERRIATKRLAIRSGADALADILGIKAEIIAAKAR